MSSATSFMNESQSTNQVVHRRKGLAVALGCIAVFCLFLTVIVTSLPYLNQYNYSYVGTNFAEALRQNNSKLAHTLTVPSQWERIDKWTENHDPLNCPFSWDFDANMSGSVAVLLDDEKADVSYHQICFVKQYYEFEIEEIILQRQNGRWQVVDWSEVQETKE